MLHSSPGAGALAQALAQVWWAVVRAAAATCLAAAMALSLLSAPGEAAGELIEERSSNYNNIFVYQSGPLRILTFGHNRRLYTETIFDTRDERVLPVEYTRFMTLGLAYADKPASILEIGSGGGRTAWYLHKHFPETDIITVELDPAVVEIAVKHFGIQIQSGRFRVATADGRRYLARHEDKHDIILVDAYRGPFVPFHLLTKEFYELVDSRLENGGVVVQNIEPTTMIYDAAIATIQSVFETVEIFNANGNVVAVAYQGPPRDTSALAARAAAVDEAAGLKYSLAGMLAGRRIVSERVARDPLTDDFAPVEALLATERHNRKWDDFGQR